MYFWQKILSFFSGERISTKANFCEQSRICTCCKTNEENNITWEPLPLQELIEKIHLSEEQMEENLGRLWNLIRIKPEKWDHVPYGDEGGGFWVVGLLGNNVIWYNDIEEGFNISQWSAFGTIDEYWCNHDELHWCIHGLLEQIQNGQARPRLGPPQPFRI